MKLDEMVRPGLLGLGLVGLAATAMLGFAAGVVITRDPQVVRRNLRRVARGVEEATLWAAKAREHVGDLWAEAREEARVDVDAADFERAAAAAQPVAEAATPAPAEPKAPRRNRARAGAAAGRTQTPPSQAE